VAGVSDAEDPIALRRYLAWTIWSAGAQWPGSALFGWFGISMDGVCPVLGRTLNHYNTRLPTIEGDA
jgi:hypothetical protein